jgi:hypothetical protein
LPKFAQAAGRILVREHLPFAAWLASWILIGLSVGHADAVRLIASNMFALAAPAIGTLAVLPLLSRRAGGDAAVWTRSLARAWKIEWVGLLICALLIGAFMLILDARGFHEPAAMLGIIALGIPARHPGQLLVAKRRRVALWRTGAAVTTLVGAATVFFFKFDWQAAALVLALRSWGGLLAALLFAPTQRSSREHPTQPLDFAQAAAATGVKSHSKLSYRIIASLLVALFGPAGKFVARTGRGARLGTRSARLTPKSQAGLAVFTLCALASSAFFLLISREPATLLLAAVSARLAAPAGAALLWWKYSDDETELSEDLARDDDDF